MPSGLEIIGNHGSLLISADTVTPGLRDTRNITASVPSAAGSWYVRTSTVFSSMSRTASLVVEPMYTDYNLFAYISARPATTGNVTMEFILTGALGALGGGSKTICRVHVFDTPLNDGPNQGLRLYDSSGKITFSSNYPPLIVMAQHPNSSLESDVTYAAPSGRRYGLMPSGRSCAVDWTTIGGTQYMRVRGTAIRKPAGNNGVRVLYDSGIGTYVPYQKSAQAEVLDLNDGEPYSNVPIILGGLIGDITHF